MQCTCIRLTEEVNVVNLFVCKGLSDLKTIA